MQAGNALRLPPYSTTQPRALPIAARSAKPSELAAAANAVVVIVTRSAADYLGIRDSFGTGEKGKTADLVVLDANPLADITSTRKIAGVMLSGPLFSPRHRWRKSWRTWKQSRG